MPRWAVPATRSSGSRRAPTRRGSRRCFRACRCWMRRGRAPQRARRRRRAPRPARGPRAGLAESVRGSRGSSSCTPTRPRAPASSLPPPRRARSRSPSTPRSRSAEPRWICGSWRARTPPSRRPGRCCRSRRRSPWSSAANRSWSPRSDRAAYAEAIATATEFSRSIVQPGGRAARAGGRAVSGGLPLRAGALHDRPRARRGGLWSGGGDLPLRSTDDQHHRRAACSTGRGQSRSTGRGQDRPHLDDRLPPRRPYRPGPPGARGRRHRRGLGVRQSAAVRERRGFRAPIRALPRTTSDCSRRSASTSCSRRRRRNCSPTARDDQGHRRRSGLRYEGRFRPYYFDGLLTVEAKLFHLVRPDVAVYGERDRQRIFLVRADDPRPVLRRRGRDGRDRARRRRPAGVDTRRDARGPRPRRRGEAPGGARCRGLQRRPRRRRLHRRGAVVAHG